MNSLSGAKARRDPRFDLCPKCQRELRRPFQPHGAIRPGDMLREKSDGMVAAPSPKEAKALRKQQRKQERATLRRTARREGIAAAAKLYITTMREPEPPAECEACLKRRAEKLGPLYILTA